MVISMDGRSTRNHNPATHTEDMKLTLMVRAALNLMVQVVVRVMARAVVRAMVQAAARATALGAVIPMGQVEVRIC